MFSQKFGSVGATTRYGAAGEVWEPPAPLVQTGAAGVPPSAPLPMSQIASSSRLNVAALRPSSEKVEYSSPCFVSIDRKSLSRKLHKVKGGGPGKVTHSELDATMMG